MNSTNNSLKKLVAAITSILIFFLFTRTPIDADLWWHLRAGQTMWEQQQILLTDSFSYTRLGAPWVNAFWLSEIIFYLLYRLGGYLALTTFVSLMGAFTFHIVQRKYLGNPFVNTFVTILAVITAAPIWGPRPQIISFFLIALLDYWLINNHKKWFIVILFVIWANLHGGWIWGFLLLVAHIAGLIIKLVFDKTQERNIPLKEIQSLLVCMGISVLAIGLNPNGIAIWNLPFEQVNVSMQIQEWLSPDFHRVDFHPFLWMIFLLLLTSPFQAPPPDWSRIFKVLGFGYLTFVAQRNIALFAIVAAPLLTDWLNAAWHSIQRENRRAPASTNLPEKFTTIFNSVIILALSMMILGYAFWVSRPSEVDKNYPTAAIQWIKNNQPTGRLFNSYNWGGYILWNLPEHPVFIDGRADLYGSEILSEWQSVVNAQENALTVLDTWDINIVFIESNTPIIQTLKENGWKVAFQDNTSIILLRE